MLVSGEHALELARGQHTHMVVDLLGRLVVKAISEDDRSSKTQSRIISVLAVLEQNRRLAVVNVLLKLPPVEALITTSDVLQGMRRIDVLNYGTHGI